MNRKPVLECKNSDGLTGFNYSHVGWWNADNMWFGKVTPLECANACMQGCVAINTYDNSVNIKQLCYHYTNKEDTTDANKMLVDEYPWLAYIKC